MVETDKGNRTNCENVSIFTDLVYRQFLFIVSVEIIMVKVRLTDITKRKILSKYPPEPMDMG